jgi:PAS domain-containing protein
VERDGYQIEKRYLRPNGEIVHATLAVTAMRNAEGSVVRFISQIEDITEKKRVERQLAERAAQLELVMEAAWSGRHCSSCQRRRSLAAGQTRTALRAG